MRVVLDANVIVSALLTRQANAQQILDLLLEREGFSLVLSQPILDEVQRVLAYPHLAVIHGKSAAEIDEFAARLRDAALFTAPQERVNVAPDESDTRYLECAREGKAEYLITGDKKHLLPIKKFGEVQILAPAEFLALLKVQGIA